MGNFHTPLLSATITTAVTGTTTSAVTLRPGTVSLGIHCNFAYGSGGTTAKAWVQTSFDGGTTWVDIAAFAHTTSSLRRVVNLTSKTAVTTLYTATDGTLTDDTVKDGVIGSQVRVKYTTTGTYATSTTLTINIVAKGGQ